MFFLRMDTKLGKRYDVITGISKARMRKGKKVCERKMDGKYLTEQVANVCKAVRRKKEESDVSYKELISILELNEDDFFSVEERYLERFAKEENLERFLLRLWVLIQCAEHTGCTFEPLVTANRTDIKETLRQIEEILKK